MRSCNSAGGRSSATARVLIARRRARDGGAWLGAVLLLAVAVVCAACDLGLNRDCWDPTPDETIVTSCEGNVLVTESYRGVSSQGTKCSLSTGRKTCDEATPTCVEHEGGASCEILCKTDGDCSGTRCLPIDADGGTLVCKFLHYGDRCSPCGLLCAPGCSCVPWGTSSPLDASAEGSSDASASDSAAVGPPLLCEADAAQATNAHCSCDVLR